MGCNLRKKKGGSRYNKETKGKVLYYFKISRKISEKACICEYVGISQQRMAVPFSFCFIGGFFSNLFLLGFIPGSGERRLTGCTTTERQRYHTYSQNQI